MLRLKALSGSELFYLFDRCFSGSGLGSDLDIYVTGVPGETAGQPDGRPN